MPELPLANVEGLVSRRAPWSEMVELMNAAVPHGFVIYFHYDVHLVMALVVTGCELVGCGAHTLSRRESGSSVSAPGLRIVHSLSLDCTAASASALARR